MIKEQLEQILAYEEYLEKMDPTEFANNVLLQDFYCFSSQKDSLGFKGQQQLISANIFTLCQQHRQNSFQQLEAIQAKLNIITHIAEIQTKTNKQNQNRVQSENQGFLLKQKKQNTLLNWYKQHRSSLIQSEITVEEAWKYIPNFSYNIKEYGNDSFSQILFRFNKGNQSGQLYLWQFFDQYIRALDQEKSEKRNSKIDQQGEQINVKKVQTQTLDQLNQIIDLHKEMDELLDFNETYMSILHQPTKVNGKRRLIN